MSFLQDKSFLLKLNRHKVKEIYAQIIVLDFETEIPLAVLTGKVISGGMNIAANSSTRRSGSYKIIFDQDTYAINNISNLISIDKKISFSIGIRNPFFNTQQYNQYGEVLWFKQGVFYITNADIQVSTTGKTVNITFIDKMGGLNGTCGGTLPASTSFHDSIIIDEEGNQTVSYPLIKTIIFEAVTHFGGEHPSRVIIEDVPDVGTQVIQYNGSTPIKFRPRSTNAREFVLEPPKDTDPEGTEIYYKGSIIGYQETELTYPGELIQKAGSTVTRLLDEIVKTLGNYEYFYDVEGNFHFRRIRNYQMTNNTPLNYDAKGQIMITEVDGSEHLDDVSIDSQFQNLYIPRYSNFEYLNEFADTALITSVSLKPKWENIKNDFICWGTKNSKDNNTNTMVRYHLAIDERPKDNPDALCHKNIFVIKDRTTNQVLRYLTAQIFDPSKEIALLYCSSLDSIFEDKSADFRFNWREELYRKALIAYGNSIKGSEYDEELLAEWRYLYDPMSVSFKSDWERQFGIDTWFGYNINVKIAPDKIKYWLDIIDSDSPLGKYSIKRIGKRTIVEENSKVNIVFEPQIPPIVFIRNVGDVKEQTERAAYYKERGQDYTFVIEETARNFSLRTSLGSCYETIRSLLNEHLLFNSSISISSLPIYYLDVNTIIHLNLKDFGIVGNFIINTINWQIDQKGSVMSIQANEALTII